MALTAPFARLSGKLIRSFKQTCGIFGTQRWQHTEPEVEERRPRRPEMAEADNMTDIGIRPIFTEEHDMFRHSARKFYTEEALPYYQEWERNGKVDREIWLKAGAAGFLGSSVPEEVGGVGADFLSEVVFTEESYYAHMPSMHGFSVHQHLVLPYMYHYGSSEQHRRYIPDMCAGKLIGCVGMTEPGAGSDLQGIKTYAKADGDDFILNGSKVFITNGYMSDVAIVVAVTDKDAKKTAHGISLLILDADMPGFRKGRILNKLGVKANDTAELFFEDVRVPRSNVLGEVNKGFFYLMKQLALERLIIAIWSQSHAEKIFEVTRSYVKERKAFNRRIADFQTTRHKLAEIKTELCITRSFVDQLALTYHQRGSIDPIMASMAKYKASDLEFRVADTCLQMFGGWGYMLEMPIAQSYLDARPQAIYGGTNEIMKEMIGRKIARD